MTIPALPAESGHPTTLPSGWLGPKSAGAIPGLVLLAGLFTGCAATNHDTWYRIAVSGSSTPAPAPAWPNLTTLPAPDPKQPAAFNDGTLQVQWQLWDWNIKLKLWNKTERPVQILWPEARIAWAAEDEALQNKDQSHPEPTTVEARSDATFGCYPRPLLQWISWGDPAAGRGHWSNMGASAPIFGLSFQPDQTPEARERRAQLAVGQEVKILLPLNVDGQRLVYLFRLEILKARNYGVWY